MLDPFPNELVEAAAQALFDEWCHLSGEPLGEWRESGEPAVWDSYAKRVLAAVLPRIEQRVIDRLAREAGEPERHVVWLCAGCDVCHPPDGSPREQRYPCAPDGGSPSCGGALVVLAEDAERWVACGVAAERARTVALARAIKRVREIEMFPDDESRDADYGPACMDLEDALSAALAPERTTTPEPEGENA